MCLHYGCFTVVFFPTEEDASELRVLLSCEAVLVIWGPPVEAHWARTRNYYEWIGLCYEEDPKKVNNNNKTKTTTRASPWTPPRTGPLLWQVSPNCGLSPRCNYSVGDERARQKKIYEVGPCDQRATRPAVPTPPTTSDPTTPPTISDPAAAAPTS